MTTKYNLGSQWPKLQLNCNVTRLTTSADLLAPTVSIDTPLASATVTDVVSITVSASDAVGVASVKIYIDDVLVVTDVAAPYTYQWDTLNVAAGPHTIAAQAYDANGNNTTSTITVTRADITPPTITINSPSNGAIVSGTVGINATVSDNIGISSVQFLVDGVLKSTVTASPYTYNWDSTAASVGAHSIRVFATDTSDNVSFSEITITKQDITNPVVTITSPSAGASVSTTTSIVASASDNVSVNRVEFKVDGVLVATDTSAPYSYSWDAGAASVGFHTIRATAYDASDNSSYHEITLNRVDTGVPTIAINTPSNAANVSGTVSITATASDTVGVDRVVFSVDGVEVATDTVAPYAYSWDTTGVSVGSHTLRATAYDGAGNSAYDQISVTRVDTTTPSISITSPTHGQAISGSHTITASASDNVSISSVVFSIDGVDVATDVAAPYSYSWDGVAAVGSHTIRATATDAANNSAYHEITVTRLDTTAPSISITAPANGSTQNGSTNITTSVSDNVGINNVVFSVDGVEIANDTSNPYSTSFDFSNSSVGSHTITAVAYDAAGNSSTASITTNRLDTTAPVVSISTPANNATLNGVTTITASASDNVSISSVVFKIDSTTIATINSAPYTTTYDFSSLNAANYTVSAIAYDAAGNNSTASVTITVPAVVQGQPTTVAECNSLASSKVGFTVTLPTDPTTTSDHTVTTNAQMVTALGANARRIIVAGNLTGTFNIVANRSDLQIEGGSYTMGTWSINDNCTRLKFIGGYFTKILSYLPPNDNSFSTHIQLIGCNINSYPSSGNAIDLHSKFVRIEGCAVKAQDFSIWGGESAIGRQMSDWIIFNNTLDSEDTVTPEATVRIVGCDKVIFCVNRCTNIEKHNFRIESRDGFQQQYTYAAYNRLVNRGIMLGNQPGNNVVDIFLEYNKVHALNNGRAGVDSIFTPNTTTVHNLHFNHNDLYTNNYNPIADYISMNIATWDLTSNTANAYSAPPSSGV